MTPAFSVLLCLGTYWCFYSHSSYGWSKCSDPLKLVVTGLSAPPSLAVLPSSEVASGQSMTLQCRSELYYDWFTLCKDGKEISRRRTQSHGRGRQADFLAVNLTHDGTYQCYGFHSSSPYQWSSPSAPLVFLVSGTFSTSPESENKPSDAAALDYTVSNLVRLILAGLILVLLEVLLAEHWKSSMEPPVQGVFAEHSGQSSPQDRSEEGNE
ncbi:leukocyte immunoglobulin-like receptor subfamily A member 6 [Monodelphis domestica]|uniref:Leukocyte immunoglobulin-like receptor subfamily A member 6 n=1 Tax=Monodelphis domestica TaxID=13616 RepID=F6U215_MONDO|nr:leukocyte immunoglobulin-like receptor subfamily A member 6 [Monodelphis domestica]